MSGRLDSRTFRDARFEDARARGNGWQSHSVLRALAILELLNRSPRPLSSSEISRSLDLPKSTTSVLLSTLESAGYIHRDEQERHYSQSLKAYGLGLALLNHLELSRRAMPVLKTIAASQGVTAHVAVLDGDQALFVNKVDGEGQPCCDIYPGRKTNLQCTAVGKVLLAWMNDEQRREFLARHRLIRHTNRTIATAEELGAMIDRVRQRGYAVDDQEEELYVRCLAVPVFGPREEFHCALGITGSPRDIRASNFKALVEYLKHMSGKLGATDEMSALCTTSS